MTHKPEQKQIKIIFCATVADSFLFLQGQTDFLKGRGYHLIGVSNLKATNPQILSDIRFPIYDLPMKREISPISDLIALFHLIRIFRRLKPTIVHVSTPKASVLAMIAATLGRAPIRIYMIRGLMTEMFRGHLGALARVLEKLTCAQAHLVLANSRSVRDRIVEQGFCDPSKIRIIARGSSNGVDAMGRFNPGNLDPEQTRALRARLGLPDNSHVVGYFGRVVRDKGIMELARAWEIVSSVRPSARLLVMGKAEPHDPVPGPVIRYLNEDGSIDLIQWVDRDDIPYYYALLDLLVLPTYREGLPNVILEASAMGLPVVATRVTGCVDAVVDGVTGTLVPAKDPIALADAILVYLDDQDLRFAHGSAGREMVTHRFRPEMVWEFMADIYDEELKRKGLQ